jgi:D-sedoheptulose 7-phosphate isomerase
MLQQDKLAGPRAHVEALFAESVAVKERTIAACADTLVSMAQVIHSSLQAGGKLLLCGNGGSAADAQHLAAELLVRLRPHVDRQPMAALALAVDMSSVTACGNDYSFDDLYARMVEALARPGDVLLAISTSGRSENVVRALLAARARDVKTLGFLGGAGDPALALCDFALHVPSSVTGRVQETHITAGHAVMELVEEMMLGRF